jgi:hypothetical protein
MSLGTMAVTNAHHPEICDVGKVVKDYVRVLICLFLTRDESLSRLD